MDQAPRKERRNLAVCIEHKAQLQWLLRKQKHQWVVDTEELVARVNIDQLNPQMIKEQHQCLKWTMINLKILNKS